ncbi:RICIN domain-containing protein [Kitasatospora sp. NPDC059408]|uniref:RICIN domain-containing protein n=1 Tax=Kitasatospora sp. NPDC059408 TaxID=3346823 RepID=UPI0036C71B14
MTKFGASVAAVLTALALAAPATAARAEAGPAANPAANPAAGPAATATVTAQQALDQVLAAARDGKPALAGAALADSGPFYFHVRAYGDGYCLDNFASGGGANNSPAGFWACNNGPTEQWRWRVYDAGAFYGLELVNNASGRCLDYPESWGNTVGAQFNVYDCKDGGAPGQTFHSYVDGADISLTSPKTSSVVALDGYSSRWQGNGSPVGLWYADTNNFNAWQRWY